MQFHPNLKNSDGVIFLIAFSKKTDKDTLIAKKLFLI
jgi:hypothetical protein